MGNLTRRLRGAFGTAVTWSVSWALAGPVVSFLAFLVIPDLRLERFFDVLPMLMTMAAGSGFVGGGLFSLALGVVYRRKAVGELKPVRMGVWGALAGMLLPLVAMLISAAAGEGPVYFDTLATTLITTGTLGLATGAGMVKLAQRGDRQIGGGEASDRSLPPAE